MDKEIREQLADYAHEAWSGWIKYMYEKSNNEISGKITWPEWASERWLRQANTKYQDLPEKEKESDRKEADRILEIIHTHYQAKIDLLSKQNKDLILAIKKIYDRLSVDESEYKIRDGGPTMACYLIAKQTLANFGEE